MLHNPVLCVWFRKKNAYIILQYLQGNSASESKHLRKTNFMVTYFNNILSWTV